MTEVASLAPDTAVWQSGVASFLEHFDVALNETVDSVITNSSRIAIDIISSITEWNYAHPTGSTLVRILSRTTDRNGRLGYFSEDLCDLSALAATHRANVDLS